MQTNFARETSLTTQVMEFTGETRTAIVVSAYRTARLQGLTTITPVLESMLAEQVELFMEENSELFPSDDTDTLVKYDVFSDPDFAHDSK